MDDVSPLASEQGGLFTGVSGLSFPAAVGGGPSLLSDRHFSLRHSLKGDVGRPLAQDEVSERERDSSFSRAADLSREVGPIREAMLRAPTADRLRSLVVMERMSFSAPGGLDSRVVQMGSGSSLPCTATNPRRSLTLVPDLSLSRMRTTDVLGRSWSCS